MPDTISPAELDRLLERGIRAIGEAADLETLRAAEQEHVGRRSGLAAVQRSLGALDADARRELGRRVNEVRSTLQTSVDERRAKLEVARDAALLEAERLDLTLPGRVVPRGAVHPITRTVDELVDIFVGLGYRMVEGPEVETDWYNFEALNFPPGHPARSMQDSITIAEPDGTVGRLVLRTHTSPVQIRTMLAGPPPIHAVMPGRCYRADTADATHIPVFNQIEGLAVAEDITMGDLKGTLLAFVRAYFGDEREIRLRPSYFPFTEPSAEVDVSCFICGGRGRDCRTCKGEGWIEILGCGMVHPVVLANAGHDPDRFSGFAFGMGIERVYMLRSGLADMRTLLDGDLRWLAGV